MAHTHELFLRMKTADGIVLQSFSKSEANTTEPSEILMRSCDLLAKSLEADSPTDAVLYKIDGVCEYMIAREFYLWPNTGEFNGRKNPSKGQQRRDRFQQRGPRGLGRPQPRSA